MFVLGLDIGNATTEAVLATIHSGQIEVVGHDRVPTRGPKGSPTSLDAAVRLVRRLERAYGVRVEAVAVAPLRPVTTLTATLPEPPAQTGRLRLVRAGSGTAGGQGVGFGPPYLVGGPAGLPTDPVVAVPVVAVVPEGLGYRDALPRLRELAARGLLAAVVVARDEAVLLANRLPADQLPPVVDEVPAAEVVDATLLAVEVRPAGRPLRALTDPLRLVAELNLSTVERDDAARLAALLYDRSNAVVALDAHSRAAQPAQPAWIDVNGGERRSLTGAHATLRTAPPGWARAYGMPGEPGVDVDDLFTVDLAAIADAQLTRLGSVSSRTVVLAALHGDAPYADLAADLAERLGVPVHTARNEAHAALLGARSTPGATSDALVVDLGGGTIDVVTGERDVVTGERDVVTGERAVVVAGAGDLLTVAVAALLGGARTTAEWAKRGPSFRVEGAQTLLAEDGTRTFLDRAARPDLVGALVTEGPAGWLAVDRALAPGEWRALRLRLKAEVLGANVSRALAALDADARTVVVVGGPAGDDEVLGCVARALPAGTAVGRGNAAGQLGHRHVVAYGLLLAIFGGSPTP